MRERGANHGHHETSVKIVNFHKYPRFANKHAKSTIYSAKNNRTYTLFENHSRSSTYIKYYELHTLNQRGSLMLFVAK